MDKTAFVFDDVHVPPERQIGINSHPQWELSHVVSGGGVRIIGGDAEPIAEGEVVLIPPGIPHVWHFDSSKTDSEGCISNITVFFDDGTLEGLVAILPETAEYISKIRELKEALAYTGETRDNIVATLYSMRGKTADARVPYMLRLLSLLAETDNGKRAGCDKSLTRTQQRLEKVRTYCHCNYARDISLDEVARYAGMNKSAFCTFMKRHAGKTFSQFVNELRLEYAVGRIKDTEEYIADIAYAVGFANVAYFNRLFRKRYGCSPKAMRLLSHNL